MAKDYTDYNIGRVEALLNRPMSPNASPEHILGYNGGMKEMHSIANQPKALQKKAEEAFAIIKE